MEIRNRVRELKMVRASELVPNLEKFVFDPFCGSGTTLVACKRLARIGYGVEIDMGCVAVCLERLASMGLEPELVKWS